MTKKKKKKKKSNNRFYHHHHHRRQRLDTVFSYQDDIQLAMGIYQYGNKWKYIWKEKNLTHIPYSSLKDRARSKAFKELMDRIIVQQQQQSNWNTTTLQTMVQQRTEQHMNKDDRNSIRMIEQQPTDYPSKDILSDLSDDEDEPKTFWDIQLRSTEQSTTTLSPTFRYWHQPIITKEDIQKENEAYL